jgi:hypothetical protein
LDAAAVKLLASLQITARAASAPPTRDWEDAFPEDEGGRKQMTRRKHKRKKKVWGVKEPPKAHKTAAASSKKPSKRKLPFRFDDKENELKVSSGILFIPDELSDPIVVV